MCVTCVFKVYIFHQLLLCLADLSKNRLTEIPPEVCLFAPLESLNLYHNCIKCIPEAIINLQMLTYLDIRWVTANTTLSVLVPMFHHVRSATVNVYVCSVLYLSRGACSPFSTLTGQKCPHEREALPLLLKLNSQ